MSEVTSARTRPKLHLIAAAALMACFVAFAVGIRYYRYFGSVTFEEIQQIQNGMTKDQVLKTIGRPNRRCIDGWKDHWHYTFPDGPMFHGGFVIRFDDQGRVEVVLH